MSKIRDKAESQMYDFLGGKVDIIDAILSIPELAIVDRGAELPDNPLFNASTNVEFGAFIRKAGYVKELK